VRKESPNIWRRRLGNELRKLRDGAGLTIHDVAKRLECSDSKISRIETAQVGATPRDVRDMLELYEVSGAQRDELVQLAREARQQKDPLQAFSDLPFAPLVGLERAAASLRMYSVLNIPGHLQTRDYAHAVIRAIRPDLSDEERRRRVELRLKRQEYLTRKNPGKFWVVLDEAVLSRQTGGIEVMHRQLQRLIELATLENVTMQVLPFTSGAHAAMDGEFTIVGFEDPADPDTVFIENTTDDLYLEDPDKVQRYELVFDDLRTAALGTPESFEFLVEKARQL
jgi:transcriptional regulator with XRE-family HTH domain